MPIPVIAVPRYTTTLPFTKKDVTFRPYLVKEEKLLIMANEANDQEFLIRTIGDVVRDCTAGVIDITKDAMFDVQHVFLQIRGKSQGETVQFISTCPACNAQYPSSMHVNDFALKTTPGHTNVIALSDDHKVQMRYPTFNHFLRLYSDDAKDSDIFEVVAECIDKIFTDEEVFVNTPEEKESVLEFIEMLTPEQFDRLESFFATMPILQYSQTFTCECGQKNTVVIDGIHNFFE
jgi:hypothetical protein